MGMYGYGTCQDCRHGRPSCQWANAPTWLTGLAALASLHGMNRSEASRLAHMRRRLLAAYGEASAADQAAGLAWYDRAHEAAKAILPDDPSRAAGVIAALSPRAHWRVNLTWAATLVEAAERGDDGPPPVHTRQMRAQAWRIALGEAPLDVLNGPKVRAFFSNITGDLDQVTVDVWAARAAGHDGPYLTARTYALVAQAYREAAAILELPPRDMQAAIWIHVRGKAG